MEVGSTAAAGTLEEADSMGVVGVSAGTVEHGAAAGSIVVAECTEVVDMAVMVVTEAPFEATAGPVP